MSNVSFQATISTTLQTRTVTTVVWWFSMRQAEQLVTGKWRHKRVEPSHPSCLDSPLSTCCNLAFRNRVSPFAGQCCQPTALATVPEMIHCGQPCVHRTATSGLSGTTAQPAGPRSNPSPWRSYFWFTMLRRKIQVTSPRCRSRLQIVVKM